MFSTHTLQYFGNIYIYICCNLSFIDVENHGLAFFHMPCEQSKNITFLVSPSKNIWFSH